MLASHVSLSDCAANSAIARRIRLDRATACVNLADAIVASIVCRLTLKIIAACSVVIGRSDAVIVTKSRKREPVSVFGFVLLTVIKMP